MKESDLDRNGQAEAEGRWYSMNLLAVEKQMKNNLFFFSGGLFFL